MIYYFSGTGNSRHVAQSLAKATGDDLRFIPECEFQGYTDVLGFVFPVYSWGVPTVVLDFIRALPKCDKEDMYVFMVATCGDDVGLTDKMLEKELRAKNIELDLSFSVTMPNTYVLLPGFDVDSKDVEQLKLEKSKARLSAIAEKINSRVKETDVVRGGMAWLKTKVIYPLFTKYGINSAKWRAEDSCVGCELCSKVCPVSNIDMDCGKPKWGRQCVSCTACYHVCPKHAVRYGNATKKKGQYRTLLKR